MIDAYSAFGIVIKTMFDNFSPKRATWLETIQVIWFPILQ
jgi:hypothetical protein